MASTKAEKGRDIQRYGRDLESGTFLRIPVIDHPELKLLLHYPVFCFPATDILMLVTAAHVGETPFFKRFKRHGCGVMEAGEKIT
jgi:hypothetical protein